MMKMSKTGKDHMKQAHSKNTKSVGGTGMKGGRKDAGKSVKKKAMKTGYKAR
ncbi:MAG: hypothetical protein JSW00_04040 [Thermoplasmata archaeon]|nr:MAG: hypothetical protein JSW00_04040 [Thermoplasmata archaeon]